MIVEKREKDRAGLVSDQCIKDGRKNCKHVTVNY